MKLHVLALAAISFVRHAFEVAAGRLHAREATGSSKQASALSKGTRFQLYLALRVAGYQELVSRRQSVPFIADDILETFDDFRAEETLKVFSQMANSGQVIYLTHHKHLCDIYCSAGLSLGPNPRASDRIAAIFAPNLRSWRPAAIFAVQRIWLF